MAATATEGEPESAIGALRARLAEINDLGRAAALLGWDEHTMMPPGGAGARAQVLATIARVRHEMFCDEEVGRLIEAARPEVAGEPHDSIDAALVRVVSRDHEKARRVPAELRSEIAHAASVGEHAWKRAREASDFELLLPHLERNVELARSYIDCYRGFEDFTRPYDALLDEYEPGMRTAEIERLLEDLREGLVPLVAEAAEREPADDSCLRGEFPPEEQRALIGELLSELPLPAAGWRLDPTAHPFAVGISTEDIRLTTRYDPGHFGSALFASLHEAGHGLYESGVDPELARTPLAKPRSLGLHESQSRLWENWVGRSRPYCKRLLRRLRSAWPQAFKGVKLDQLHAAVNRVEPSLIRVEADELTYNLHILIRFELELELFDGDLKPKDLPGAWNRRYRDYLGLKVPDDARGVLQDTHWAGGSFGYFPTYSLGNVIAGQLWEAAGRDLGDPEALVEAGELEALGGWLRERVHRFGRRLSPTEILDRAGCGPLSVEPLLDHLRSKASP